MILLKWYSWVQNPNTKEQIGHLGNNWNYPNLTIVTVSFSCPTEFQRCFGQNQPIRQEQSWRLITNGIWITVKRTRRVATKNSEVAGRRKE